MFKCRNMQYRIKTFDFIQRSIQKCYSKQQLQLLRLQSTSMAALNVRGESDFKTQFSQEWQKAKPYDDIPTVSRLAMVRNCLPGGKYHNLDAEEFLLALKQDLGGICKLPSMFGRSELVFTHSVEDFETIFRNEGIWPDRPGLDALNYHRSVHRKDFFQGIEGVLATKGEKWGTFRSTVNPVLMQPKTVKLYMKKMSQVNKELIKRILEIRDPKTLEVPPTFEEDINRWTLESVSVVALDKQLGLLTENRQNPLAKQMFTALLAFVQDSLEIEFKPSMWRYYKTKTFKRLMSSLDTLLEITQMYVNEAVQRLEQERLSGQAERAEKEKSVLEKLIKIDKKVATVMAMDLLTAGVDTSSSTFVALLLNMAKNPDKQEKLREEITKILPHKDSDVDEEAFKNMPYLRACIKETLRYYPLVVGNARAPANDIVLSGYHIPKGTRVTMVNGSLLRDEIHFPRANEYLPERWLRTNQNNHNVETNTDVVSLRPKCPFVFLPFGFGSRTCIGRRILEMEVELGIARILRNFHVEFNYTIDKPFKTFLMKVPNIPLRFKFTDIYD